MTDEEIKVLQSELETLRTEKAEQEKTISDLTAERDSFKTENEKLSATNKELLESEKKLKETNFTLARHLDVSGETKSAEEILNDMFK